MTKNRVFVFDKMNMQIGVFKGEKSIAIGFKDEKWPQIEFSLIFCLDLSSFAIITVFEGHYFFEKNSDRSKNLTGLSLVANKVAQWITLPIVNKKCLFWSNKNAKKAKNWVFIFGKIIAQIGVFEGEKSIGTRFKTSRRFQIGFSKNIEKFQNFHFFEIL